MRALLMVPVRIFEAGVMCGVTLALAMLAVQDG